MNFITILLLLAGIGTFLLWTGLKWRRSLKETLDDHSVKSLRNKGQAMGFIVVGSFMLLLVFFGLAVIIVLSLAKVFN